MAVNLISWAQGKKTYISAGAGILLGVLQGLHETGVTNLSVPWYVIAGLGFVSVAALRSSVQKSAEQATVAAVSLAMQIIQAVRSPAVVQTFTPVSVTPTAEQLVTKAAQSPSYATASEQEKTEILNLSQLNKEHQS